MVKTRKTNFLKKVYKKKRKKLFRKKFTKKKKKRRKRKLNKRSRRRPFLRKRSQKRKRRKSRKTRRKQKGGLCCNYEKHTGPGAGYCTRDGSKAHGILTNHLGKRDEIFIPGDVTVPVGNWWGNAALYPTVKIKYRRHCYKHMQDLGFNCYSDQDLHDLLLALFRQQDNVRMYVTRGAGGAQRWVENNGDGVPSMGDSQFDKLLIYRCAVAGHSGAGNICPGGVQKYCGYVPVVDGIPGGLPMFEPVPNNPGYHEFRGHPHNIGPIGDRDNANTHNGVDCRQYYKVLFNIRRVAPGGLQNKFSYLITVEQVILCFDYQQTRPPPAPPLDALAAEWNPGAAQAPVAPAPAPVVPDPELVNRPALQQYFPRWKYINNVVDVNAVARTSELLGDGWTSVYKHTDPRSKQFWIHDRLEGRKSCNRVNCRNVDAIHESLSKHNLL